MRKRIIPATQQGTVSSDQDWLDVEALAEVEITSEDVSYPIEAALLRGGVSGWRAAESGKQTIRLIFTHPNQIKRIGLKFIETRTERTQEYVLRWSADGGKSFQEIVRQQWNFSPSGATEQAEEYRVDLQAVTVLELTIIPDISGGGAIASLAQLRLA